MQSNPSIAVVSQPFLSAEQCEQLLAGTGDSWQPSQLALPAEATHTKGNDIRRCSVSVVTDVALLARLEQEIAGYNAAVWEFDLDGLHADDPPTFMRYTAGDHFDWHIDNAVADVPGSSRKLGFTLQLSAPDAYDGGDLELALYAPRFYGDAARAQAAALRLQGSLTVFPAFHLHRVSPVTRGVRTALVGWLHGPALR